MNRLKTKPRKSTKKRKDQGHADESTEKRERVATGLSPLPGRFFPRSTSSVLLWGVPRSLERKLAELRGQLDLELALDRVAESSGPERGLWALAAVYAAANDSLASPPAQLDSLLTENEGESGLDREEGLQDSNEAQDSIEADRIWALQLVRVELPLSAACLWPRDERRADWIERSMHEFERFVTEHLDLDGTPEGRILPRWAALVASWTRSHRLASKCGEPLPDPVAEMLSGLALNAVRWLRPDGALMLGPPLLESITDSFKKYWLRLSDDPDVRKLAKRCSAAKKKTRRISIGAPEESEHSEWGQVALLQDAWEWGTTKCAIQYSQQRLRTEIGSTQTLLLGDVTPQIRIDGHDAKIVGDIEQSCWHQDEELDYIELAADLEGDASLHRQVILLRGEKLLIVLDSVLAPRSSAIEYEGIWPLAAGIDWQSESETTESYLKTKDGFLALLVPLSLPEWKMAARDGGLSGEKGELRYRVVANGRALCAALAIDLDPDRAVAPRTWRHLTVAEQLQVVPQDVAVAYRLQLNKQQWVLYRSLGPVANRSFIGVNFADEFFIGRLHRNGRADLLLQIEG